MSIFTRVLVTGACALLFAITAAAQTAAPPSPPDVSGTYSGELTPDDGTPGGRGVIVLTQRGDALEVKLGESLEQLLTGVDVKRNGATLLFEVDLPGDEPNHLAFEVSVAGEAMTGKVTQTRDGRSRTAKVTFTRQ
jgi:hypothetical protein